MCAKPRGQERVRGTWEKARRPRWLGQGGLTTCRPRWTFKKVPPTLTSPGQSPPMPLHCLGNTLALGRLPLKSRPSLHSSHTRSLTFAPVIPLPGALAPSLLRMASSDCHSQESYPRYRIMPPFSFPSQATRYLVYVYQPLLAPLSRQELSEGMALIPLLLVRSLGPRTMPST